MERAATLVPVRSEAKHGSEADPCTAGTAAQMNLKLLFNSVQATWEIKSNGKKIHFLNP
jgi:hypothetical protein